MSGNPVWIFHNIHKAMVPVYFFNDTAKAFVLIGLQVASYILTVTFFAGAVGYFVYQNPFLWIFHFSLGIFTQILFFIVNLVLLRNTRDYFTALFTPAEYPVETKIVKKLFNAYKSNRIFHTLSMVVLNSVLLLLIL